MEKESTAQNEVLSDYHAKKQSRPKPSPPRRAVMMVPGMRIGLKRMSSGEMRRSRPPPPTTTVATTAETMVAATPNVLSRKRISLQKPN